MSKIIDISLPISPQMPVYPGTDNTKIDTVTSPSGNVLSVITLTSHAGSHVDAPSHSIPGAPNISDIPLDTFYGECRVINLTKSETQITKEDLSAHNISKGERILLKTKNSLRGFKKFYDDYVFLSPDGAEYLASLGVSLVGIDSLSIKQKGSTDNSPHTNLLSKNIPILEGINLSEADEDVYTICAFPLSFSGIDGSPVRAILFRQATNNN